MGLDLFITKKIQSSASRYTLPHANELKVVIYNKSDFAWAEKYAALVSSFLHALSAAGMGKSKRNDSPDHRVHKSESAVGTVVADSQVYKCTVMHSVRFTTHFKQKKF